LSSAPDRRSEFIGDGIGDLIDLIPNAAARSHFVLMFMRDMNRRLGAGEATGMAMPA